MKPVKVKFNRSLITPEDNLVLLKSFLTFFEFEKEFGLQFNKPEHLKEFTEKLTSCAGRELENVPVAVFSGKELQSLCDIAALDLHDHVVGIPEDKGYNEIFKVNLDNIVDLTPSELELLILDELL